MKASVLTSLLWATTAFASLQPYVWRKEKKDRAEEINENGNTINWDDDRAVEGMQLGQGPYFSNSINGWTGASGDATWICVGFFDSEAIKDYPKVAVHANLWAEAEDTIRNYVDHAAAQFGYGQNPFAQGKYALRVSTIDSSPQQVQQIMLPEGALSDVVKSRLGFYIRCWPKLEDVPADWRPRTRNFNKDSPFKNNQFGWWS